MIKKRSGWPFLNVATSYTYACLIIAAAFYHFAENTQMISPPYDPMAQYVLMAVP